MVRAPGVLKTIGSVGEQVAGEGAAGSGLPGSWFTTPIFTVCEDPAATVGIRLAGTATVIVAVYGLIDCCWGAEVSWRIVLGVFQYTRVWALADGLFR